MVEFVVRHMKKELAEMGEDESQIKVIATGGLANLIDEGVDCIDEVDKLLTLEGLEILYEKNRRDKRSKK